MGVIKKFMNFFGVQRTEYVFEYVPSWQERAREQVTSKNATQLANEIADSRMPLDEKMDAFDVLYVGINGSESMSYTERSRALSEFYIASERAQAEKGNITWKEYYAYEQQERELCTERIAQQRSLGLR